jgi:hypothetical protein
MSRKTWLALFCIVGLGPTIAIKVAAPPTPSVVEPAQGQSKTETEPVPNELAKSDRLELPNTRVQTENIVPPAETPLAAPETIKKAADRRWQDANARTISVAWPRRHRHAKSKESKKTAGTPPPNARAEVWHCRRDAMGSLLRSLDLSPLCDL